ncbi:aminopeptidase [Aquabacterium sp.]|uniref:aminopeptidase n=1 Tax=Aquabacterium sp. TaxID=1872578 RepID=UPI002B96465F|nr:aminopeptidase [Aquabacterium sp.]HSW06105.1 aminopeptidase [Aquabacterium sp.]
MTLGRGQRIGALLVLALASTVSLVGCSSLGYYAQSVGGHLELMRRARPVTDWLADEATPAALRERLKLSQQMRDFAVRELHLPDNRSYRSYADLGRNAVVWNVVAAPELSLTLKTWCYPMMGCVGYRGYFDRAAADALAETLKAEGLDVNVYGVSAYSTLGWTNWLGGDPLLNTFIRWPEGELARLIFHELAHQVAYAADDTSFNESFATAVERLGGARWRESHGLGDADDAAYEQRRRDFRALGLRTRASLEALYRSAMSGADKRTRKTEILAAMRAELMRLKVEAWAGYSGYDSWAQRANNASLGVQAAYDELVPDFERLFNAQGRDFTRFYAEVQRLAALPKAERRATLQQRR